MRSFLTLKAQTITMFVFCAQMEVYSRKIYIMSVIVVNVTLLIHVTLTTLVI